MDTEVYGQIPIFSRNQIRTEYIRAVKSDLEDLESLIEDGIIPFPKKEEMVRYDESVEFGLNHALEKIEKSDATDLPNIFMIDTEERDAQNNGSVWIVAEGEVIDFTKSRVFHESNLAA